MYPKGKRMSTGSSSVHVKPIEVGSNLADLGVTMTELRDAIEHGEAERAACTPNDVGFMAGLRQWSGTLRRLRELQAPRGWRCDRSGHIESVLRKDGLIAIAVAMGDEFTGDAEHTPRTKHPRGDAVVRRISGNRQLLLFPDAEPAKRDISPCVVWILLIHTTDEATYSELSLPLSVDEEGHVNSWAERIILDPISHDPEPIVDEDDDGDDDIQVNIQRRAQ